MTPCSMIKYACYADCGGLQITAMKRVNEKEIIFTRTSELNATLESKKITQSRWKSFIKTKHPSSSVRPKSAATVAAISASGKW